MAETATTYEHIVLRDQVPMIAGTSVKVIELVLDKLAYGWSPEEMHLQHPHLSLGQIHSALAYYWDHAEALDADIQRRLEEVERLSQRATPPPLLAKLRARGLL
jgi:uncharacterized protein (DUF433 family)